MRLDVFEEVALDPGPPTDSGRRRVAVWRRIGGVSSPLPSDPDVARDAYRDDGLGRFDGRA